MLFFISTTNAIIQFSVFFLNASGFFTVNLHIFRLPLTLPEKYIVYMFHVRYSLNISKDISFRENVQSSLKGLELNYYLSDAI